MAKNKIVVWIIVGVVAISLVGLTGVFSSGSTTSPQSGQNSNSGGEVPCLTSEVFHIHPTLQILVGGQAEPIPGNIGILPGCTRELHTHATDGVIHVEAAVDRGYVFGNFLTVWGKPLEREGYALKMTVDGTETTDPNFTMKDGQEILLEYNKI